MAQSTPAQRHSERLVEAFNGMHMLELLLTPTSAEKAFRATLNADLRQLRKYIAAGVPCLRDHPDALPGVTVAFFRTYSLRWMSPLNGKPNPMRKLFLEYVAAGYVPLNEPMPDQGLAPSMRGLTHFDYAVRCAKDPGVVPLLLSLGADETLVATDRMLDGSPRGERMDFTEFVHACALERTKNKGLGPGEAEEANVFRVAALEGLMQRRIAQHLGTAPDLPSAPSPPETAVAAPASRQRRTLRL